MKKISVDAKLFRVHIENSFAVIILAVVFGSYYVKLAGWPDSWAHTCTFVMPFFLESVYLLIHNHNPHIWVRIALIALLLPVAVNILWMIFT